MIRFLCPACETPLAAPEEKGGTVVNCRRCRQPLRIPTAQAGPATRADPPAPMTDADADAPATRLPTTAPVPDTIPPIPDSRDDLPAPPNGLARVPGYRILDLLGAGGMGAVYRAEQVQGRRLVALKVIKSQGAIESHERARFRAEAEAAARLQHPNIAAIYDIGEWRAGDGGPPVPYFSMELCPQGSLAARLDGTPWQPRAAAALAETAAVLARPSSRRSSRRGRICCRPRPDSPPFPAGRQRTRRK